jgi:raffinose/stachyose/melibiose transport system permease protein
MENNENKKNPNVAEEVKETTSQGGTEAVVVKKSSKKKAKEHVNWPVTILLILGLITVVFPLYMTIVIAFKQPSEMTNSISGILSLPKSWSLSNFKEAMEVTDFWNSLGNSLFITLTTVVISILLHSMLGYAIGRNKGKKKGYKLVYFYVVSGMFVPFAILMLPLVKETAYMHLDNMLGVVLLYVVFYMPMNVLLYSGYLTNIPLALEEAAYVDGATTFRTYWSIVFPIMKPMHATVAILTALGTWNDVMTPLVIMSGSKNTLPLAQLSFQTQFGANYNLAFASYLLALLPIIIFYIICQKQILNGVVSGAVK